MNSADWNMYIEQWQTSGQSQKAFCEAEGLSYWQFRARLKRSGWQPQGRQKRKAAAVAFVQAQPVSGQFSGAESREFLSFSWGSTGFRLRINLDLKA